jgi:type IX secretion system PorP/SprF family membrane protein
VLSCGSRIAAQDIHFSQFYASPLTLNPALTGYNEGTYRVAGIYRNQWKSVTVPYVTYGGSFDSKLLQGKLKNDILGVGINFNADKSGSGKLMFIQALASVSYHKSLDKQGHHYIALGFQAGYVQKTLQYNLLSFPTQFNGSDFDLNMANGESFTAGGTKYVDLNAGLMWHSQFGEKVGAFAGFTYFHINRPKESFLGKDNRLDSRYLAHAGLNIKLAKQWYLKPNFIFMYQSKATEVNFGTAVEYHLPLKKDDFIVSLGGWYRLKDAGIASIAAEYKHIRGGFAYDINASSLKSASHQKGAFEIYLMYTGFLGSKPLKPIQVPCPMM